MHLIIDGYGGDAQKMQDLNLIYEVLDEYPAEIGMTKIAPPYVFRYSGINPEHWGITGFVLIAESHISIHTFPERGYVNVDVFSCKEFNAEQAVRDLQGRLGLTEIKTNILDRGLDHYYRVERTGEAGAPVTIGGTGHGHT